MRDVKAVILSNKEMVSGYFKMALDAPFIARSARPGQFVMVRCSDGLVPLLRRPLGIHRLKAQGSRLKGIEILYEVVGKGTELLAEKQRGDFIDILGPLGNGFAFPRASGLGPRAILVAGGIGVAPLVFLASELAKRKVKTIALIGAKSKKLILCEKDFRKTGAEVHTATDDGTCGSKGLVSKLVEKTLRTANGERRTSVYACGPQSMLQCIAGICKRRNIECQVSLEEKMACGIGACLGCIVKVKAGNGFTPLDSKHQTGFIYKLACKDGPIFNTKGLIWQLLR